MRTNTHYVKTITLAALLFTGFTAGSIAQDTTAIVGPEANAPTILATSPADGEMNVNRNGVIEITFSSEMDAASINGTTLLLYVTFADTLKKGHGEIRKEQITDVTTMVDSAKSLEYTTSAVHGSISYSNKIAVFTPGRELKEGTLYTFTVTTGVKDSENIALDKDQSWNFTTTGTPGHDK